MSNPPTPNPRERKLEGLSIAPGLGYGTAWMPEEWSAAPSPVHIEELQLPAELKRIEQACAQVRSDLRAAAHKIEERGDSDLADIFHAHELMLDDLDASAAFVDELERSMVDAAEAVRRVLLQWEKRFLSLATESFRQRADDVADLARKLLRHLSGAEGHAFDHLPAGSVLVTARLLPSEVVLLSRHSVAAIVVEQLGAGAHAALLAREKSIPTVAGFPGLLEALKPGDPMLVDATRGTVVIAPLPETRAHFAQRITLLERCSERSRHTCHSPAHTLDGVPIGVQANLGTYEDVALVLENGADGVGLFRTEQLYLARETPPSEDELLEDLRAITRPLRETAVTVRLLDVGGDKPVPFMRIRSELNPQLGLRGVRMLLQRPQITRTQLRALVRLAQEQEIRVLVPLVTLAEEMAAIRELLAQAAADLGATSVPKLGAMVETPAAALSVPEICREVDFLSIGTNDLTQYTMAAARDNPSVCRYYDDGHVTVLRLLRLIMAEAGQTPVNICGELAGREEFIPELVGMGFRSLSVSPPLVPAVKELVRTLHSSGGRA
jgi:phosphoenolpyruvate-protein phosphotransferase